MSKKLKKREIEKFSRQIILKNIGVLGQKKILNSKVLIIGMGGLGCPAADFLTRSGLAAKKNISVLNTPGTIDSDYRGEIKVIIYNHGNNDFTINNGDRIAQMILTPVVKIEFEETSDLPETIRGEGGFGSTGK